MFYLRYYNINTLENSTRFHMNQTWEHLVSMTSKTEFNKPAQRRDSERQKIIGNVNKYESDFKLRASN